MGKPRSDEERKAQNQKQAEREKQRRKNYVIPEHLKEPPATHKTIFDRFTNRMVLNGKEVEVLITPEPGNAKIEGLPTVYCIDIDHTFFGWLRYAPEGWTMKGKQREVVEMIGNVVQEYYE